jgi:hypothetical protein
MANLSEIEFVCNNSYASPGLDTPYPKLVQLFNRLKDVDGVLPYMQDFSDDDHTEMSLAAIMFKPEVETQIRQIADELDVQVDLVQEIHDLFYRDVANGSLEYLFDPNQRTTEG